MLFLQILSATSDSEFHAFPCRCLDFLPGFWDAQFRSSRWGVFLCLSLCLCLSLSVCLSYIYICMCKSSCCEGEQGWL